MDDTLRRNVCRLIAGIIVSDDDLDDAEDKFIDRLLARFGIPLDERDTIFPIVDRSEASDAVKALPTDVQQEAFDILVEATLADGKIAPEERAYLDTVAGAIGLSASQVDAKLAAHKA
ncbi:MAG: TerB family tellurite resistance protein [Myxococcales bacterium]|nr:TerB family tellurite resistance protein [Myxococcales bacterium]